MGYTIYQLVQDFFHPQDMVTKCDANSKNLRYFLYGILKSLFISWDVVGYKKIYISGYKKRWDMMGYDGID